MVIAMLLAHLVGDFVLQWDSLARWKSHDIKGVLVHCLILSAVTAAFALSIDPSWWSGILLISISHLIIDSYWVLKNYFISPLTRVLIDQAIHIFIILLALVMTGYLQWSNLWGGIMADAQANPLLTAMLGYTFLTMPAWVMLKFLIFGIMKGRPPNFSVGLGKYMSIGERLIIMTLVLFGQALFLPLVALPRLVLDRRQIGEADQDVYVVELVSSVVLAIGVGLLIRSLVF